MPDSLIVGDVTNALDLLDDTVGDTVSDGVSDGVVLRDGANAPGPLSVIVGDRPLDLSGDVPDATAVESVADVREPLGGTVGVVVPVRSRPKHARSASVVGGLDLRARPLGHQRIEGTTKSLPFLHSRAKKSFLILGLPVPSRHSN